MAFFQPAPVPTLGRAAMKRLARQLSRTSSSSSSLSSSSPLAYSSHSYSTSAATKGSIASQLFVCRRCLHLPRASRPSSPSVLSSVARSQTAQQFRNPFAPFARCLSNSAAKKTTAPSPPFDSKFNSDSETKTKTKTKTNAKSWPETTSKSVAYWLLGSAASVFGIVVFGGLTRLTESG